MKIRTDFVTNSSSSSFILAFGDEVNYKDFCDKCESLDYEEFMRFIENIRHNSDSDDLRKDAEELLRWSYVCQIRNKILAEKFKQCEFEDFKERIIKENEFLESEEYRKILAEKIVETDYEEKRRLLDNSDIVIYSEIWDTEGGLLEWAIRNGFIREEMYEWLVLQWDIG